MRARSALLAAIAAVAAFWPGFAATGNDKAAEILGKKTAILTYLDELPAERGRHSQACR